MTASLQNMNGAVLCHFSVINTCFLPDVMINLSFASTWSASCAAFEIYTKHANPSLPSVMWHSCLKVESSLESELEVDQCPLLISD